MGAKHGISLLILQKEAGFNYIQLEVRAKNTRAQNFYKKKRYENNPNT